MLSKSCRKVWEMPLGIILSEGKISIWTTSGREWAMPWTANVGGDRMKPGYGFSLYLYQETTEGGCRGRDQLKFLSLGWETIVEVGSSWPMAWICGKKLGIQPHHFFPERTWNFTSIKRGQMNIIVMKQIFHKSWPANKKYTSPSILFT